jgi:hypothetical protein
MFHRFYLLIPVLAILSACSAGSDTTVNAPNSNGGSGNSLDDKQGPAANAIWDKNFSSNGLDDSLKYLMIIGGKVYGFGTFFATVDQLPLNGAFVLDSLTIKPLPHPPLQNGDSVHVFTSAASDGSTMYGLAYYWHSNPMTLKFDGTSWSFPFSQAAYIDNIAVAGGKLYGSVRMQSDSAIYINFDGSGNIFNGQFGTTGRVLTMAGFGNELYAATLEDTLFTAPVTQFDHFDGTNWSHMPSMALTGKVKAIKKVGGQLYAFGETAPDDRAFFVAHWTGSKWDKISGDMNGDLSERVADFDVDKDGHYYAATSEEIFKWDGHTWARLGEVSGGYIQTVLIYRGMLIAGGTFFGMSTGLNTPSRCIGIYH